MKIKSEDLWNHVGTVFYVPEDLYAEEYDKYNDEHHKFLLIPKGTYLIVDTNESVVNLYDIKNNINRSFEPYFAEDKEFDTVYVPSTEILKFAIDSITKRIMELTAEGWTADPDNEYFNLTPELQKLSVLKATLQILGEEELE
jgi:hypothetical protein